MVNVKSMPSLFMIERGNLDSGYKYSKAMSVKYISEYIDQMLTKYQAKSDL